MTSERGAATASVVSPRTSKRYTTMGIYPRHSGARTTPARNQDEHRIRFWSPVPAWTGPECPDVSSLLSLFCLLPFRQEGQSLGLVEIVQERLIDRHWTGLVADQLTHALDRRFAVNIGSQRVKIGLVGDDVLPTLRQNVVEEQFPGVRIARFAGNESNTRGHHRVVLRQDDAEVGILF